MQAYIKCTFTDLSKVDFIMYLYVRKSVFPDNV
jgi:hypothetical protein